MDQANIHALFITYELLFHQCTQILSKYQFLTCLKLKIFRSLASILFESQEAYHESGCLYLFMYYSRLILLVKTLMYLMIFKVY